MFPSSKIKPIPTIKLYRSNSCTLSFDNLKFNNEPKTTISYGESILFIVKSPMGTTVLSKTLTGVEGEELPIQFDLIPEDTVDLCAPFKYDYSVSLYTDGVTDFFTLERGVILLRDPCGDINDIETD
jgi:hypothetical protein